MEKIYHFNPIIAFQFITVGHNVAKVIYFIHVEPMYKFNWSIFQKVGTEYRCSRKRQKNAKIQTRTRHVHLISAPDQNRNPELQYWVLVISLMGKSPCRCSGTSLEPCWQDIWTSGPSPAETWADKKYKPVLWHCIVQETICVYMTTWRIAHVVLAKHSLSVTVATAQALASVKVKLVRIVPKDWCTSRTWASEEWGGKLAISLC